MTKSLDSFSSAQVVINAASAPTSGPTDTANAFSTAGFDTVTTYVAYSGTVSSGTLQLWLYDGGTWYKGATLALKSSDGNGSFDWPVGSGRVVTFSVPAISGGGSVTVKVEGS